jgi:ABC-type polysaccharide/polyol phosphate export permease
MEIDKIKKCWKEEDRRISENININKKASFQKLHSSYNRIRAWRLVRIIQWCIVIPLFFVLAIFPNMKNDGSTLFYIALVLLILITLSFCISYIYHYVYLSKIDFAGSISEVQKKIFHSEMLDKKIYLFRFIFLLIAFLCAFKIFGVSSLESEKIMITALIAFMMIYTLIVRLKFIIPKEYSNIKSSLDEMGEGEERN